MCLCQKHYFRQWRYGSTNTKREQKRMELGYSRKYRTQMDARGYQRLYEPNHPLADSEGGVYEHRKVVFDQIGFELKECELCSMPVNWKTVHIDHIDNNPKNNHPSNLRPLCRVCNTGRNYPEAHTFAGNTAITIGDVTLTAAEWSRVSGGFVTGSTIARRIKGGMSPEQALTSPKVTHGKGMPPPYTREGLIELARHYREETRKLKEKQ